MHEGWCVGDGRFFHAGSPRRSFEQLWDSIYNDKNKPQFAWDKNPWVWVISFDVIHANIDEVNA